MNLRPYSYLTLDETKEWLNIKLTDTSKDNQVIRHINTACARVESYIDGPVLNREYTEYSDGNNSNVVIPTHFPISELTEVKIDYNRAFDSAEVLSSDDVILRGWPPLDQPILANASVQVNGIDVVLRDDGNVSVLGRIFTGSVVQSIRLKYKAGRGDTPDDLPEDLRTATLMLVEWLYMLKENREVGVVSKGVMGQNYTRKAVGVSGMPVEIEAMLDDFKDWALPPVSVPQKNFDK